MNTSRDHAPADQQLETILRALLDPGTTDLPAATGMTCEQLAVIAASPRAVELIQSLTRLIEARARIAVAQSLIGSIAALEKVMTEPIQHPRHAETIRKAASTVIRLRESLNKSVPLPKPISFPDHAGDLASPPDTPPDASSQPVITDRAAEWLTSQAHAPAP